MLAVWWVWHDVILDLRRDAVRIVWWCREVVSGWSTKLPGEQKRNELSGGPGTPSIWVFRAKVLVGSWARHINGGVYEVSLTIST